MTFSVITITKCTKLNKLFQSSSGPCAIDVPGRSDCS